MPNPETLEEIKPQLLPEEQFGGGAVDDGLSTRRALTRDILGDPDEIREISEEEKNQERNDALIAFEEGLIKLVDDLGRSLNNKRSAFNFSDRYKLYERRANSWLDIHTDAEGAVVRNEGDGDRLMNYTLGLSQAAINSARPIWHEYMLESGPMPNSITSRGRSDDSSEREEIMNSVLTYFHEESRFGQHVASGIKDAMSSMLGVVRQRWVQHITVEPDDTGKWARKIAYKGPQLDNWPLPWVWFSHPNRQDVSESKTVVWYSRTNLHELETEAFVEEVGVSSLTNVATGEDFQFPFVETAGRHSNLERLRRMQDFKGAAEGSRNLPNSGRLFENWVNDERTVDAQNNESNHFDVIGRVDVEGYVPMGSLVPLINKHVVEEWEWDIENVDEMSDRELARLVNSIFWDITVTDTGILHYCRPTQYRPARNTALAAPYSDGEGLYGPGIPELGADAEDAIDEMMNDHLYGAKRRNLPNYALDMTAILDPMGEPITEDSMNKFINGFAQIVLVRNMNVDEAIKSFIPEINPTFVQDMNFLLQHYSEKTMINDELRGAADNNSATADRQNLAQSLGRGVDRAKNFARLIPERIDRNILLDMQTFLDDDEFDQLVVRVAGEVGLKAHYVFPSVNNLASQFTVRHSGSPLVNKEVKVAQMNQIFDRYAPTGELKIQKSLVEELKLLEFSDPESFLTSSTGNRDPRSEIKAFAADHYLAPSQEEDLPGHYRVHIDQLIAIAPELAAELLDPELMSFFLPRGQDGQPQFAGAQEPPGLENMRFQPDVVIPQLVEHVKVTQEFLSEVLAQMLAESEAEAEASEGEEGVEDEGGEESLLGGGPVDVEATQGPRIVEGIKRQAAGLPKGLTGAA